MSKAKLLTDRFLDLHPDRRTAQRFLPPTRTRSNPAITLDPIIERSSSANTVAICIIARPNVSGVDALLLGNQRDIGCIQFRHSLLEVQNRATKTIHQPYEKDIEPTAHEVLEHLVERWSLVPALTAADPGVLVFLDDLEATVSGQCRQDDPLVRRGFAVPADP